MRVTLIVKSVIKITIEFEIEFDLWAPTNYMNCFSKPNFFFQTSMYALLYYFLDISFPKVVILSV